LLIRVRANIYVIDCSPLEDGAKASLGRKYAMLVRQANHFSAARTHAPETQGWKLIIILGCFPVYLFPALLSP